MTSTVETRGPYAPAPIRKRYTPDPESVDPDALAVDLAECLSTGQVAATLKVTEASVARWREAGCRGVDGRMHVLPSIRVGSRVYTHKRDLAGFIAATNARA